MNLFNRKISFGSLPKSDIVIFDETNSRYITDFILDGLPCFIYDMRPEKIYISASVIYSCLKTLRSFNWKSVIRSKNKLRAILRELLYNYRLGCFRYIKPKIVITSIDNSGVFHWLCKNHRKANYCAIQNGNRIIERYNEYNVNHYFCFGDYDKDIFMKAGYAIDNYYPVGSLLAGYYKYNNKSNDKIEYDIGIVSSYRSIATRGIRNSARVENYWELVYLLHSFLEEYITEYELHAAIFMNYDLSAGAECVEEREYLTEIYGKVVDIIDNNKDQFSTYQGVDNSDIVIGFRSTVCREAFGWGKKLLICDFTGTTKYNDRDSMIMFTDPNYKNFEKRLNELRDEPYDEYRKRTKEYASYLMNYDPNCPPHKYIRKKIEEYL